jgi:rubrerythrin
MCPSCTVSVERVARRELLYQNLTAAKILPPTKRGHSEERTMAAINLSQAFRNAIEVERAANRFYTLLGESTDDAEAKKFLEDMAEQEFRHAAEIEEMARKADAGELPVRADDNVEAVETAPEWAYVDGIAYADALAVALEAEQHACLYYEALADSTEGEIRNFFVNLGRMEQAHVEAIQTLQQKG